MSLHPLAGKPATAEILSNIPQLVAHYYTRKPDPQDPSQRVAFGTSGHRGSSQDGSFNEDHILAITQALCDWRREQGLSGPLFLGMDTHALSEPALMTALCVLAANQVEVCIQKGLGYTPTPVISHAILVHNRNEAERADGVVITPSHNPPRDGGFKYNPTHGGPAGGEITSAIENRANALLEAQLEGVKQVAFEQAINAPTTRHIDYIQPYVDDLSAIIDMDIIREKGIRIGVDPMGGSGIHYWKPIAQTYGLNIELVNETVDPAFGFMRVDKDGKIRMDCSSSSAMAGLVELRDRFDIAFANDPDYDRHGIVTPSSGLMNPNHYLAVAIDYLLRHRPDWRRTIGVGKTLVSSAIIDRVVAALEREVTEVPVGFKWFVDGLSSGQIAFGGEESAGATFLRKDGSVWTTDKDGIVMDLLAAEICARCDIDPGMYYKKLTESFGAPVYERLDAPATKAQKSKLKDLSTEQVTADTLAGDAITEKLTHAPGNGAAIGGLKVSTANGWFAARPSGTEDIYKIYAESFLGSEHLRQIQEEAKRLVDDTIS